MTITREGELGQAWNVLDVAATLDPGAWSEADRSHLLGVALDWQRHNDSRATFSAGRKKHARRHDVIAAEGVALGIALGLEIARQRLNT